MGKINTNIKGYNLKETGDEVEELLQSVGDKADRSELPTIDSSLSTMSDNPIANKAVANAIDDISDGKTTISPNLSAGTRYLGSNIGGGLSILSNIEKDTNVNDRWFLNGDIRSWGIFVGSFGVYDNGIYTEVHYDNEDISMGMESLMSVMRGDNGWVFGASLDSATYSGYTSLADIASDTSANKTAIAILNGGDTTTGSVDKKIKDAINTFSSHLTDDGIVNTYQEALNWIARHGSDYTALLGQVTNNTTNIGTLQTSLQTATTNTTNISNGTTTITPTLGNNTTYGNIGLGTNAMSLNSDMYSGYTSLSAIASDLHALKTSGISISDAEKAQLIAEIKQAVIADMGANVAHYKDFEEE